MNGAFAITWLLAAASADPRVGIFVGSNGAPAGLTPLQHAEADAARLRRVFVELGGLPPENAHLLEAPTADQILQVIKERGSGAQLLVFYYSGHADQRALLLEGSELSFAELDRALAEAGAQVSLHLVDACRSGALTRRKGARLGEPFHFEAAPKGEGKVVITSSAEWEDSHESDRLGGSFFTLHLATGLRGAADGDRDGRVTLAEAYGYVYGRTVESTLASSGGSQHPTFAYDLSGQGDLVLTWPSGPGGVLTFGEGEYLVLEAATQRVAAEINTPGSRITLPPGEYRILKRTRTEVWSGRARIGAGASWLADQFLTEREAHARLVRKGGPKDPELAQGLRAQIGWRGPIDASLGAAPIFRLGYELVLPWLSLSPYLSATWPQTFETPRLVYRTQELGLGVLASRALDFEWLTVRGGLLVEGLRLAQVEAEDREPSRTTWGAAFGAQLALESPPFGDFGAAVLGEVAFYLFRRSNAELEPIEASSLVSEPNLRLLLALGYNW
ncbi:MAG: caspase family protein [Deltaproteobacteria bacterium]|nr:caspase family protein [Deltaproteobacteria bacterium]